MYGGGGRGCIGRLVGSLMNPSFGAFRLFVLAMVELADTLVGIMIDFIPCALLPL